ncbi:hypothetical protein MTO96_022084 [Rhipicephalus appendiculatus]
MAGNIGTRPRKGGRVHYAVVVTIITAADRVAAGEERLLVKHPPCRSKDEQELSVDRTDESNGEYSSGTEPLEPASEGTPPYVFVEDYYATDDAAFPYGGDYLALEKGDPVFIVQPEPQSRSVPPVLPSEQALESSSNQFNNDALGTDVRAAGALSSWLPKARVLVVFAAVSCSLAVAAWLVYRQLAWTPRRFAEMRADQTDSIIADYTEPALAGRARPIECARRRPGCLAECHL